jgi:glycosyltransferase involved in cell wall biosynthesis
MRILLLAKRFPQGRDLLLRPYGRYFHLPAAFAANGHDTQVALLSYRRLPSQTLVHSGMRWSADDLLPGGFGAYLRRLYDLCRDWRPDWIIGASDIYFALIAQRLSRRYDIPYAIDAYDDFESYMPWAWPLHLWWRRSLAAADLVTVPGPQLAERLAGVRAGRIEVVPMTADPSFVPMSREECRARLGLPKDRKLIGQIGAFNARRGKRTVLEALRLVRQQRPGVTLVLSGRDSRALHAPPDIHALGYLSDEDLPAAVNALDVASVSLADNYFCRSSYPAKLCEALACRIPVVASDLPPARWMLGDSERALARVGDARHLAEQWLGRLDDDRAEESAPDGWRFQALRYLEILSSPV